MDSDTHDFQIFAGTLRHALDAKNRVTVPSRWRRGETEEFYAIADPRRPVVVLLPAAELRRMNCEIEALGDLSVSQKRAFTRQLFAQAQPCPVDKQGRLVLPQEFCSRFSFEDEVVLAGTGTRIEIFRPEDWEETCRKEREAFIQGSHSLGL
ncbi:MAG: division/cell wall cluster transcriptional repressor MraZ [Verrucomicrobiales bacterium]